MNTFPVTYEGVEYATTTYEEACDHAELNWRNTNGAVAGGGYLCRFHDDDGATFVRLVHIRISDAGIARLVSSEEVK